MIPQANPGAGYRALKQVIDDAVARSLASGWYVLGAECAGFEAEFATWLGVPNAIGCANGTDALALILRGLGIGAGAAVATVSHTAVATVAAIEMAGATPVLLDVEPDHMTLDAQELDALLSRPPAGLPPIRAVIAVHLYGQPADLDAISAISAHHGLALIEDCSQAHGALWRGRKVGTFGTASAFSLYPTKNLGALGDGGIVTTARDDLAERVRALRQYGWEQRYVSTSVGVNSRLDEIQAAILRAKLPYLDRQNEQRRALASAYDASLANCHLSRPARRSGAEHVFHQYVVAVDHRDQVQALLRESGIGTAVHYPLPVHKQPAYAGRLMLGHAHCRVTDSLAPRIMSLPMYPELSVDDVAAVCRALCSATTLARGE